MLYLIQNNSVEIINLHLNNIINSTITVISETQNSFNHRNISMIRWKNRGDKRFTETNESPHSSALIIMSRV